MIPGTYNLIDGALMQKLRFDNISNNLANINTNAFKRDNLSFHRTLSMKSLSRIDFSSGPIRHTGNKLDVALNKQGFFKIRTPAGVRYTRDGAFTLNADGTLTTLKGDTVLGQNGPITIEGGNVSIQSDGGVLVDNEPVDKILVVNFKDLHLLKKEGYSRYVYQGQESESFTAENIEIKQGYLEKSNVSPTEEMIKMIEAYRAFESAQKAIQTIDELTSKLVNDASLIS